jgi:hypothetical protein
LARIRHQLGALSLSLCPPAELSSIDNS